MAMLQRSRVLSNQRLDLPDYENIENFICADFKAIHKYVWTNENWVFSGFEASGEGTSVLSITLAGSSAVFGKNDGVLYIGAPSLPPLQTTALTQGSINYVELYVDQDTGGADSRTFWDPTAAGGQGGEFSQIVDTYIFLKANLAINTSSFSGDPDKIPIATVVVDGSGNITSISDQRPMFFRLGRPNISTYKFPWVSRMGESSGNPYDAPDKQIKTIKQMFDALTDSIREIKGTTFWYELPNTSLINSFRNTSLSVLTAASPSGKFTWNGTSLEITDASETPQDSDAIAYLRLFDTTADLTLTRESIPLTNHDVVYVELPDDLSSVTYSGIGASETNYRISPLGGLELTDRVYWLAFREGSRIYVRGMGELEIGESRQINDETSLKLATLLGFDPETANTIGYVGLPDPDYTPFSFTSTDPLTTAIGYNAENINSIFKMLDENAYEETLDVVASPVGDYEIGITPAGTNITLPPDSRDALTPQSYLVGDGVLELYLNGQFLIRGRDYEETGTVGELSTEIKILRDLNLSDALTFRISSLGGFNIGGGMAGIDATNAANIGDGAGQLFKNKSANNLQFRTLKAGAGISITTAGDTVIISTTGGASTPYFRNDITGQNSALINTGGSYNLGTNKLTVFRNGQLMLDSETLGASEDRYQEASNNLIALKTPATADEVFSFVNFESDVAYRVHITGITGTTLTVPTYSLGNSSIMVFRNGIMMNDQSLGSAVDQYSETSTTTLELVQAATSTEVFTIISGLTPSAVEHFTGSVTNTLMFSNSYVIGSGKLLIFRNGVLMIKSGTIGSPTDRYQETASNSVTLEVESEANEYFTVIFI